MDNDDDIESQGQHVSGEDSDSAEMNDLVPPLVDSIEGMFKTIRDPLTVECCIYRVPDRLRRFNEATYTPRVLSIGPFHRGKENFQTMENHKVRYLKEFLERTKRSLNELLVYIFKFEKRARHCYAETIELSSDEFVKMILLDGVFIIEFLLRRCVGALEDNNDDVVLGRLFDGEIHYDLILLENQIPFFLLEKLYMLDFKFKDQPSSFLRLASAYFFYYKNQKKIPQVEEVKHFTDLLRIFQGPTTQPMHKVLISKTVSATELHKAGIKFKTGYRRSLFDIQFTNGVLEIPDFIIGGRTETVVINLMAFEQCHYPDNTYICDYYFLMDSLINTEKDVDLLVQSGIIINHLEDNAAVATLINKHGTDIQPNEDNFFFAQLLQELNKYYEIPRHKWKATLKRNYCNTPWRIASTTAAVLLLVLTFIQAVCSIISLLE